jgi:hypothetical protein
VALARLAPPVGALLARATRLPDGDWRFPESV